MRRFSTALLVLSLITLVSVGLAGCMSESLVKKEYSEDFYEVPRTLSDSLAKENVTFLVFGDTQTGWRAEHKFYRSENWFTWKQAMFPFYQLYLLANGVVGAINYERGVPDYGYWSRNFMSNAITAAAKENNADFALFLGDAADDGRRAGHWGMFLEDYGPLLSEYPLLPTPGNHAHINDSTGLANYEAIFDYPLFYVQDTPNAAIFSLNSNYIIDQHGILDDDRQDKLWEKWFVSSDTSDSLSWLEQQLEKRKNRPFKIVAMHHPPVSFSWHLEDWYESEHGRNLLGKRTQLLDLLQKYDVQVIFGGHEHLYEHNMLRYRWGNPNAALIHQIISSGGGTPPRPVASPDEMDRRKELYSEQGMDVVPVKQESVFHYTKVNIQPGEMAIETYWVRQYYPHRQQLLERIVIPRPTSLSSSAASP